jgi:sialate O-acetylesterase
MRPPVAAPADYRIRVACLGDSITAGFGTSNPPETSYPAALGRMLGPRYNVQNFGHNGACVTDVVQGKRYIDLPEFRRAQELNPYIAIVMLGSNDAPPDRWRVAKKTFESEYERLLEDLKASAPNIEFLIVLSPPPAPGLDRDPIIRGELTDLMHEVRPNVLVRMSFLGQVAQPYTDYLPDGIHPNDEGALQLAKIVHTALVTSNALNPTKTVPKRSIPRR